MYSDHTFLYVLCNPPTNSEKYVLKSYVPIRSEQPSRVSRLIYYVPTRSTYVPSRSTSEFNKNLCFSYVPSRSVQQYRENNMVKIETNACSTVSQTNAGEVFDLGLELTKMSLTGSGIGIVPTPPYPRRPHPPIPPAPPG